MKFLGHPVHLMLIHFPAALFPMELVCYFIFYKTGNASFSNASFYAMCGGVLLGWLAILTGAIDLIRIKNNGILQAKALIHGFINSTVVITYSVLAYILYRYYPNLPLATITMLAIKVALNILMLAGNYLGGNLVLKYKIGVHSS
ncbi:MAG: hypothetical protein JWQ09_1855 [Segetibacter sp.]|nr:hypothetical protein [Segetibacter sp.]